MARQVLPWVGAAIGAMAGGNWQLGFAIGSLVGNAVDPQRLNGPKLGDARQQTAREGVFRPIVLGVGQVAGNVIHRGPRIVRIVEEEQGKGGGPIIETDRGYRTFAIRIGQPPTTDGYLLLRIWESGKLVYDARPETEIPQESVEYAKRFNFYPGTEDQLPDAALEAYMGAGNVCAYNGTCYIVFPDFDLTDYGDMVPEFLFEVASMGASEAPPLWFARRVADSNDLQMAVDHNDWHSIPLKFTENFSGSWVVYGAGRLLAYSHGAMNVSINNGDVFTPVADPPNATAAGYQGIYAKGRFWIPCGGYGLASSQTSDDWASNVISGLHDYTVVFGNLIGIRAGIYGQAAVTFDDGQTWGSLVQVFDVFTAIVSSGSNGDQIMLGGEDFAAAWTTNGATFTPVTLPFSKGSGAIQTRAISGLRFGNGVWVATTNVNDDGPKGQVAYSTNAMGPWLLADNFGGNVRGLEFGHGVFVAVGDGGKIKTSTNGKDWTDQPNNFDPSDELWSVTTSEEGISPVDAERITLSSIVRWCHQRVNANDFDVTELESDLVDGIVFSGEYSARDAITSALVPYYTDAFEGNRGSGYLINYVKRNKSPYKSLTRDDLVDEPEERVREDSLERPKKLHLHYQSPIVGYAPAKASIMRTSPDALVVGEVSMQTPISFSDKDEPWWRADIMFREAWTDVGGVLTWSVSDAHLDITPTDVLTLTLRGQVLNEYVLKAEYADGVAKLETKPWRLSNYVSYATGPVLPGVEPPPPSIIGPTLAALLNMPVLNDDNDMPGIYWAAAGINPAWHGAVLQVRNDGAWQTISEIRTRCGVGMLIDDLPAHEADVDYTNTLRVQMREGMESVSFHDLLRERNALAIVRPDNTVEVVQFQDADEVSENEWELTTLIRGRLDTQRVEHLAGSTVVVLDTRLRFVHLTREVLGNTVDFRVVGRGTSPEQGEVIPITFTTLESQREWQPYNVEVEHLPGCEYNVSFIGRHRLGTDLHPIASQWFKGWRIDFTAGDTTKSRLVQDQSFHYDTALQTEDWGSVMCGGFDVTVTAVNEYTGGDGAGGGGSGGSSTPAHEPVVMTGTFPDGYVGEPYIIIANNGVIGLSGAGMPEAYGQVVNGVSPLSAHGTLRGVRISGVPMVAETTAVDLTVIAYDYTTTTNVTHTFDDAITIAAKPTYSMLDTRFASANHKMIDWMTWRSNRQPMAFRSRAGFSTGKCRAVFDVSGIDPLRSIHVGVHAGSDALSGPVYFASGVLAFEITADGQYAVELDADTGTATLRNMAGTALDSGTISAAGSFDGKYRLGFDIAAFSGDVTISSNFGNEAWPDTPTSGFGGIPNDTMDVPVSWTVRPKREQMLHRYSMSYYDIVANQATTPYFRTNEYLLIGTIGKSSGQWKCRMTTGHRGGGRVGLCVNAFDRDDGRLGDPGTQDSFGVDGAWYTGNIYESSATVYWCFGGVPGSVRIENVAVGREAGASWVFAFDADNGTCQIFRRDVAGNSVLVHIVTGIPAGTWFPAISGPGFHLSGPEHGNSGVAQDNIIEANPPGHAGFNPWTVTV